MKMPKSDKKIEVAAPTKPAAEQKTNTPNFQEMAKKMAQESVETLNRNVRENNH